MTAVGVVISMALAGEALRWPRRAVLALAALFCAGLAVLDGRELDHQFDEAAGDVAALAALALVLHLGAAAATTTGLVRRRGYRATTTAA